jgi:hypothetical protein
VGKAMIEVAADGYTRSILHSIDINALAAVATARESTSQ